MGLLTFVVLKVAFIPKDAATDTQVWETLTEHRFTPTDRTTLYREERPNMMITKNITYSEKSGDDYTLWFEFFAFEDAQHAMSGYDSLTTELSQIERNYTNDNIDMGLSKSQATICLDAANGGNDTGYVINDETMEKDLNLALVLKIGQYLSQADYHVVYTRSDDTTIQETSDNVSENPRVQIAKQNEADYLISIQMADDVDTTIKGYSFFTHPNADLIDLANAINDKLMAINYSRFDGLDSDHYDNFSILQDSDLPSLLIQIGYLTNEQDVQNLTDEHFQDMIARAISEAILAQIN